MYIIDDAMEVRGKQGNWFEVHPIHEVSVNLL